eukprot:COSAG02_NODE_32498_length_515_cov_0.862981_1_plen_63_part_10
MMTQARVRVSQGWRISTSVKQMGQLQDIWSTIKEQLLRARVRPDALQTAPHALMLPDWRASSY